MGEVKNILEYLGGYCPIMWEQYIQYGIGRPVSGPPHQHFTFLQKKYLSLVCIKCFLVFFYVFDRVKYCEVVSLMEETYGHIAYTVQLSKLMYRITNNILKRQSRKMFDF